MDAAYQAAPWIDLFVAMAGAAAALAGLLFVAVANNLDTVVAVAQGPSYAAEALLLLVAPVFVGLAVLVPDQPATALGVELVALAAVLAPALAWFGRPGQRAPGHPLWSWSLVNVAAPVALAVGLLAGGLGVLTGAGGGLYWLPGAVTASLAGGLATAWTLLVEIRRPAIS